MSAKAEYKRVIRRVRVDTSGSPYWCGFTVRKNRGWAFEYWPTRKGTNVFVWSTFVGLFLTPSPPSSHNQGLVHSSRNRKGCGIYVSCINVVHLERKVSKALWRPLRGFNFCLGFLFVPLKFIVVLYVFSYDTFTCNLGSLLFSQETHP